MYLIIVRIELSIIMELKRNLEKTCYRAGRSYHNYPDYTCGRICKDTNQIGNLDKYRKLREMEHKDHI